MKQKKENKNNIIYWLLTRYYFLAELFHNNDTFAELIKRRYDYFKANGVDFEFFDKIISFSKFADFVIDFVQKNGFSLVEQTSAPIVLKKVNIFQYIRIYLLSKITWGKTKDHYLNKLNRIHIKLRRRRWHIK